MKQGQRNTAHARLTRPRARGHRASRLAFLALAVAFFFGTLAASTSASAQGGGLPADDLFDEGGAAPTASPPTDGLADIDIGNVIGAVTRDECEKTNTTVFVGAVIVDVSALILFFLLFWLVARRGRSHPWIVFFGILVVLAAGATIALAMHNADPETLLRCKKSAELAKVVIFDGFADWQRGLLLGGAPVIVLGTLIKVVVALVRR